MVPHMKMGLQSSSHLIGESKKITVIPSLVVAHSYVHLMTLQYPIAEFSGGPSYLSVLLPKGGSAQRSHSEGYKPHKACEFRASR